MPALPTSSEANTVDVSRSRVVAAMPAAAPAARASVGDTSSQLIVNDARATPRKIAGKTGPPRNPAPRLRA